MCRLRTYAVLYLSPFSFAFSSLTRLINSPNHEHGQDITFIHNDMTPAYPSFFACLERRLGRITLVGYWTASRPSLTYHVYNLCGSRPLLARTKSRIQVVPANFYACPAAERVAWRRRARGPWLKNHD
ncbi:hypothetical protein B0J15DRAFT_65295 [Fusarium solani]|uniref:Uncharacterized protein n=1 Tax=Fusarium solani TaxID=169388 RepID=A0A9P9H020_FUSSL|nr:uncharacterized protein B0J15DRAFT_65295 [Fusarium solani]KAH7247883.1 hypothetical protein B0J15DRAFT_65295 [Fusarium solani]